MVFTVWKRIFCFAKFVVFTCDDCEQAMSLKMADTKVTLGLSEPFLGGNAQAKEIFGFLQSKTYSKDREGFILGDVFADGVVRNGGFSEFSEKVNGRVAQLAFPMGLMSTFDGDLLDQIAAHPVQVSSHTIEPKCQSACFCLRFL